MAGENDGILYCSVLKGDRVLAQSSSVKGNFLEFSRRVLEQSDNSPHRDKATYASGNYMLHYMRDGMILYLCITDDEFERSKAFLFLSDIRKRFVLHRKQSKTSEDATFNTVISDQMEYYSRRFLPQLESINTYKNQLNELEEIEIQDIGSLAGDRVRLLPFSSTNLDIDESEAVTNSGVYSMHQHSCYKNRWNIAICGSLIFVFSVIMVILITIYEVCDEGFDCR